MGTESYGSFNGRKDGRVAWKGNPVFLTACNLVMDEAMTMKKRHLRRVILVPLGVSLLVVLLLISQAAATTVTSTFDTGMDGWTGIGASVSWDSANGNPTLGSLQSLDNDTQWAQVVAPVKFHGAWGTALNPATISADIKFVGTGSPNYPTEFAITDGTTTYFYKFSSPIPSSSWHTYSVSMSNAGWTLMTTAIKNSGTDGWLNWNAPTLGTETLAQVLANVTDFHIRTDCTSSQAGDIIDVDNVKLSWVPLPSTMLLLGSGILGLGLLRYRRKSKV